MQLAASEAEANPDTSFFWLRNTGHARARSLMLDLGVDFLKYDRKKGVLCLWTGEGLRPAQGYVTMIPSARPPTDSVGLLCDIEGECASSVLTETWTQFRCR